MRRFSVLLLGLVAACGSKKQSGSGGDPAAVPATDPAECAAPITCKPVCEHGDLKACAFLGGYYLSQGMDEPGSKATAQAALERACTGGELAACVPLADLHLEKEYPRPRDAEGKALAAKACDGGIGDGCEDAARAIAAWEKTCGAGGALACFDAAQAYTKPGPDEPSDSIVVRAPAADAPKAKDLEAKGRALLADACAKGRARGCLPGQRISLEVAGVELAQLERGCALGNVYACLAGATKTAKAPEAFVGFLEKACALDAASGCTDLVTIYAEGSHGVGKDVGKAREIAHRACTHAVGGACELESALK